MRTDLQFSRVFTARSASIFLKRESEMRWIALVFWMGLCFAVAGISGRWTAIEVTGWYRTLARPGIAPPNWVFGPVWTLLYALMALSALALVNRNQHRKRLALQGA